MFSAVFLARISVFAYARDSERASERACAMSQFDIRAIKRDITRVIINIYLRNEPRARYVGVSFTFTGRTKISGSQQEAANGYAVVDVTFLQCDGRDSRGENGLKRFFDPFSFRET